MLNANATRSIGERRASSDVQMCMGFRAEGVALATVWASAIATTAIAAQTACRSVRYDLAGFADPPFSVWPNALVCHAVRSLSLAVPTSRRTHVGWCLTFFLSLVQGGAANPCSGHGKCLNDTTCECSPSWAGEKCDDLCPGGLNNACSGHGKCITNTANRSVAMCICEQGNGQTSLLRWYMQILFKSHRPQLRL